MNDAITRLPKSKLIFKPLPLDDPRQRQPDLTKAKELYQANSPKKTKK